MQLNKISVSKLAKIYQGLEKAYITIHQDFKGKVYEEKNI